jgi:hypothetical protein
MQSIQCLIQWSVEWTSFQPPTSMDAFSAIQTIQFFTFNENLKEAKIITKRN